MSALRDEDARYTDGCASCNWFGEPGQSVVADKCPECGDVGSMLGCRDIDLDGDVRSAAYRYDAFNEGMDFATTKNWLLIILRNLSHRFANVRSSS